MDVLQLLSIAYGGDKAARTEATAKLESAIQSPDGSRHLVTLLRAGTDPSLPSDQSLSALLYAKNSLLHTIPEEQLESTPGVLDEVKSLLYTGAFRVPVTHQSVIYACIATVISSFDWNYLPQLIPAITRDLSGVSAEESLVVLHMLYVYIKRFKVVHLTPMDMKVEVSGVLLTVLPSFLAYGDLRVDHIVFKAMECVVETALQSTSAKEFSPGALDVWFEGMAQHPERHFTAAREAAAGGSQKVYEAYVRSVKRIAMISFSVLNDATRRKSPAPVAKQFLTNHAASFFGIWRRWLEYSVAATDLRSLHRKVDMFAMRYMRLCTMDATLYQQHLHPNIMQVIESLLFPFLCFGGEDDEAAFADDSDLSDFAQYMMEEGFDQSELTQRQAASNSISTMVGAKKKFHDPTVLQKLIEALTTGLSRPDTAETFPQTFGFLHLLSILRKHLRTVPEIWQSQMAQVLMNFVAPRVLPSVPFVPLRCKALVVCQRYSKAPIASEEHFASFVQLICALVQDSNARIRLGAIDAMCTLLEMKRARTYIRPTLIPLVDECIGFLNRVQTAFVPTVLLYLADHFAPELTPVLGKLGVTLAQHFLAIAFDMQQKEDMENALDEGKVAEYERAAFSATAILDALSTVVLSSIHNMPAFLNMRPDLVHFIQRVLEDQDNFEFLDKALVIFLHVVNFSKPIPPECWNLLPLLFRSVENGIGVDYFATIEEVLDNYISNGTVEYIQNVALMEATYGVCEKMLLGGVSCSTENKVAVPQLIEAMLHQSKHCTAAPNLFDVQLPRFVALLLRSLMDEEIRNGEVRLQIWIIAALMDAFYYNAAATLQIMVESNAYPQFFDALFHFFRGIAQTSQELENSDKKKNKIKTKRRPKDNNAQEVIEELSILTRKVIALGLTALLHEVAGQPAFDAYLEPTLTLIEYCISRNDELYTTRCRIALENIARIRQGVEDEVEDVDLDDEGVLGLDGGADIDELDTNSDTNSETDEMGEDGLHGDEGDDYESPIDDVCEATLFLQWAVTASSRGETVQSNLQRAIRHEEAFFQAAEATARRYRQLVQELEQVMKEDFSVRSSATTG